MTICENEKTPLYQRHVAAGARIVPFAGWLMPMQYRHGIVHEHEQTRRRVSLFDTCHMGELLIDGAGAAAALDRILPRPVSSQPIGSCRYNFLVAADGGILDDLVVYRFAAESFFLVVNASRRQQDFAWLQQQLPPPLSINDLSSEYAKLDLQGPLVAEALAALGVTTVPGYFKWCRLAIAEVPVLLSRTGYTGELGVEIYCAASAVGQLWDQLLASPLVEPAGLGARDTLRLEMGYPLYGAELSAETTVEEAGFGALLPAPRQNPRKHLVGLVLASRRAARAGAAIISADSAQQVGNVTSGAFAPSLGHAIALGYIDAGAAVAVGSTYNLVQGNQAPIPAAIVDLPFYRQATARHVWNP